MPATNPKNIVLSEAVKEGIESHMSAICSSLNTVTNKEHSVQTFIDFGLFLQKQFPGEILDEIRDKLMHYANESSFANAELPKLDLVNSLSEARIVHFTNTRLLERDDPIEIGYGDALYKGLNMFYLFLGEKRVDDVQQNSIPSDKDINQVVNYYPVRWK